MVKALTAGTSAYVSSGLVSRGFRLRIPDISPASVQVSSEVAAPTVVSEVLEVGSFLGTYSAWDLLAAMSSPMRRREDISAGKSQAL